MIYKALHRKLKIEYQVPEANSGVQEDLPAPLVAHVV
jgi:hypothetical protein